jgi:hypothetical protein
MGQLLRSDHPETLAGYARFTGHDITWRPWGELGYSVKTGMPAFDRVFDASVFEYLSQNPAVAAVFDEAMTSISATEARATPEAYDFRGNTDTSSMPSSALEARQSADCGYCRAPRNMPH